MQPVPRLERSGPLPHWRSCAKNLATDIDSTAMAFPFVGPSSSAAGRLAGALVAVLLCAPFSQRASAQVAGPPQSLSASVLGSTVTLSWQPPIAIPPGLSGYLIEAGSSPGSTSVALPLANVLTYSVSAPNGRYFVRVRALVGATPGTPSPDIEVVVPTIPTAPTNLVATVARFTVNLTWRFGFGSSEVTQWEVHAGSAPGLSNLAVVPVPGGSQLLTATVPEGRYYVRVVARNQTGASPPSAEVEVITGPSVCNLPSTPTGFAVMGGRGGVNLRWDGWSGYLPTGFLLVAGTAPELAEFSIALPRITAFSSPAPPGTFYARLATYNACGQSPFTPAVPFTVVARDQP